MYFTISRGKSPKDDGPLLFDVVPLGGWVVVRYQLIESFEDDFSPPHHDHLWCCVLLPSASRTTIKFETISPVPDDPRTFFKTLIDSSSARTSAGTVSGQPRTMIKRCLPSRNHYRPHLPLRETVAIACFITPRKVTHVHASHGVPERYHSNCASFNFASMDLFCLL